MRTSLPRRAIHAPNVALSEIDIGKIRRAAAFAEKAASRENAS
jgi:hypothetical protein